MKYRSDESPLLSEDGFLLAIVHDLRAHLRASMTNSQFLKRSAAAGLPAESIEQLERIVAANKELDRFLSRLSDYAGASQVFQRKPITLEIALQTALLQFPSRAIELSPVPASASELRIPQESVRIFVELIDNALKFSSNQPVCIDAAFSAEDCSAIIRVVDTGIGIDLSEVNSVFQPLTRLNARDQFPGAGLGLSICRRIAGAIGAKVTLAPSPTGGSIATVTVYCSE